MIAKSHIAYPAWIANVTQQGWIDVAVVVLESLANRLQRMNFGTCDMVTGIVDWSKYKMM